MDQPQNLFQIECEIGLTCLGIEFEIGLTCLRSVCTDSRDRGPGGISSEDFPSYARMALVDDETICSSSHDEMTCVPPWISPFVSQNIQSS